MGKTYPLTRERNIILASLLVLAAAAWGLLLWQSRAMDGEDMGLAMGMGAPLFMVTWVAMMMAMMFPTAAPMVLTFAKIHGLKRQQGQPWVPTWVFVGGYLLVWSLAGGVAFGAAQSAEWLAHRSTWFMDNTSRIGAGVLLVAGIYQVSPLKRACLVRCRTPLSFIITSWRDGYRGSLRMGIAHGMYCLGCCWLLFVILFPLGMMNIAAMAAITILIFLEKSTPVGRQASWLSAAALIGYGVLVLIVPDTLPTMIMP